jgi:hypothetical protein
VIVTGIALPVAQLGEKTSLPSPELVHLAVNALKIYQASNLYTCLARGWEQALAKAALELQIPMSVMIPYPEQGQAWPRNARAAYHQLRSQATELRQVISCQPSSANLDYHCWMAAQSDLVIVLWDYTFQGEVFQVIDYAIRHDKRVVNLWQEWENLSQLRQAKPSPCQTRQRRSQACDSWTRTCSH